MTLEQAYQKAWPGLRHKMAKSVELIQKAERLARMYDPENGFYLAFSGGKDSQALYHITQLAGVAFKAHFSPTSVDPPQVIRFIRKNYPDCEFEKVDKSMYQVAKEMGMVPTMKLRWCCAKFKESAGEGKVTLTGVRHAESIKRSKRKEVEVTGHKFAGDIEEFFAWSAEKVAKKMKNINQDEFSRDKEQEVRCINGKDSIIVNPLVEWTDGDVWDFLNKVMEVPHCELYDPPYNRRRIGCILCPMSSRATKLRDIELYPYVKQKWLEVFEYFIGGGVQSYLRNTQKIKQFCEHGGAKYRPHNPEKFQEMAVQLHPRSECTQSGQDNCPPRRENKKRETKMGRSRGKFVGPGSLRLVAYA